MIACRNSKLRAKKLYGANLRLAQAFYPVLNLFEVILRNRMNEQLSHHFRNPDWILHEKTRFMSDQSLARSQYYLKNCVVKAENKIRNSGGRVTAGKVISEQTLGFWTSLFDVHHFRLIGGCALNSFPSKPTSENRRSIFLALQKIKEFRNRVYHNEPICFSANRIDLHAAVAAKKAIYDLIIWIDPVLTNYLKSFDNIDQKIRITQHT